MRLLEAAAYGLTLFLALVFLAKWKRRRDAVVRMNRGLSSYVTGQKAERVDETPVHMQVQA